MQITHHGNNALRHLLSLKYIDAVARTRSIRAAAKSVSITPSALNRRILAIEQELGVKLFERTSKGVSLNSAGELFVQHIRTQSADLERVRSRIADLKGIRLGHIRIATTPEFSESLLPIEIQKYRTKYPGVTFEILIADRIKVEEALTSQISDLAIILEPNNTGVLHEIMNYGQQIHVVVSSDHVLAMRKSIHLIECLEYDLLLPMRGNGIREVLETASTKKRVRINPAIESNDFHLIQQIVSQGNGIGFTAPMAFNSDTKREKICYIPLDLKDVPLVKLFIGQLRFRTLPVATAKFVERFRLVIEEGNTR